MAQEFYEPMGWATQNGDTTGAGYNSRTIVITYVELDAAIISATIKVIHIEGTIVVPKGKGIVNLTNQSGNDL